MHAQASREGEDTLLVQEALTTMMCAHPRVIRALAISCWEAAGVARACMAIELAEAGDLHSAVQEGCIRSARLLHACATHARAQLPGRAASLCSPATLPAAARREAAAAHALSGSLQPGAVPVQAVM
jgi:hypothetical protein